jgi:excisionase family DNA binding protein
MAQVTEPYTASDVSKMLGVIPKTVARWAFEGKVPGAFKTPGGHWRFDRQAIDTLVKEQIEIGN